MRDPVRHAVVIGAGLAGAAVSAALAQKGWHITLVDAATGPAQGASALPVGMLSPHVTRSPTPLSRLSELGVKTTRAELSRLVAEGKGWQACEVDNLLHDPGRWPAALVRPSALVDAWLAEASNSNALTTLWNTAVDSLKFTAPSSGMPCWQLLDKQGSVLAQAPVVVVASAFGSHALLVDKSALIPLDALPLRPVKGQMSLAAAHALPLAERPQRNNGVFVPAYEDEGLGPLWPQRIWAMGSTYDRGDNSTHVTQQAHQRNQESLAAMNPDAAEQMQQADTRHQLLGWAQVRCASLDRLPLAGALPHAQALQDQLKEGRARRSRLALTDVPRWPGLFTLSALGSRGLTLALPMAQSVANQINGESTGLELDLQNAVDPARFLWRSTRKQAPA